MIISRIHYPDKEEAAGEHQMADFKICNFLVKNTLGNMNQEKPGESQIGN